MKKLFVSFTALIFLYSLIFTSLPENIYAETSEGDQEALKEEIIKANVNEKNEESPNIEQTKETIKKQSEEEEEDEEEPITSSPFAIMKADTNLYEKDLKTIAIVLHASDTVYHVEPTNDDDYYFIKLHNKKLFVKTKDLEFVKEGKEHETKSKISAYIAPKDTIIYESSTGGEQLATIHSEQEIPVIADVGDYFEVHIGGVNGYIKKPTHYSAKVKNGNLLSITTEKVVGKTYESDSFYHVEPTSNKRRYKITIGSNEYLINSIYLVIKEQTIKAPTSSRNDIITIKGKNYIYADKELKQPIFYLSSTTKTKVLSISGSNYRVQVGNVVGYVPVQSTTEKFAVKLKNNAIIYKNKSKTSTVATNKNSSVVYTVSKTTNNSLFALEMGSKTYYVNYSDITFTTNNPKTSSTSRKDTVKTKKGFVLYKNASTKTPLFTNGLQNEKFVVAGTYGEYYKVYVGNNIAYLPIKYAVVTGKNREVSAKSGTKLYKYTNGKYVAIGTLSNGFSFKPTSSNSKYYLFTKGKETFAVKKSATVATNKSASLKAKATATYPVTLYTERKAAVYNSKGKKIGTINKGQAIALKGISNKKNAIFDFMGQQAEMSFTDLYHKDIVYGKMNISYSRMSYYLQVISLMYPEFTKLEVIGKSVEGRKIYALRVGKGKKEILMDASFHAREHMTTNVLLEMIDSYSHAYSRDTKFSGYDVRKTLNKTSIWFLPMMNPDGVMIVQKGIGSLKNKENIKIVKKYARNGSYKHWKANARGVDLNVNFDAINWYGIGTKPNYYNYQGPKPNSEPETQAFINFANKHNFKTNLSYHSSGSVIYWQGVIKDKNVNRDYNLVKQIGKITGYPYESKPKYSLYDYYKNKPRGFSTAWIRVNKEIPALTIEIAPPQGERPVALIYWDSIWKKHKTVGLYAAKEAASR